MTVKTMLIRVEKYPVIQSFDASEGRFPGGLKHSVSICR